MAGFKRRAETEPSADEELHSTKLPCLDHTRAIQSMQQVTALNTQFARWVEKQLHDHPNELWQEGVQDYLNHASNILKNFSDVVEWLKANTKMKKPSENGRASMSDDDRQRKDFPTISINTSLNVQKSSLPMVSSTSYPQINTQVPISREDDTGDDGAENEPSSPSLKRLDEPGVKVVYEAKCKLYVKADPGAEKAWKDMGTGNLTIKCRENTDRGSREAKSAIILRNDVGKVLLNALLYSNMKINVQKNTVTGIFHSAEGEGGGINEVPKAKLYLLKLKSESDAEKLAETITLHAPVLE